MNDIRVKKPTFYRVSWSGAVLGLIVLQILLHLPMMHQPPIGQHVWRQTVGHAAARNYAEEDLRFLYPRADIRMTSEDTGIIYHELPITSWLAALANRYGETPIDTALHWCQLLFNLLGIMGAYLLMRALSFSKPQSFSFAFLIASSPLFFYYAPLLEPNMLGLSLFLLGCGLFVERWNRKIFDTKYWIGVTLITLSTLAKPTFLFFGLPLAAVVGRDILRDRKQSGWLPLFGTGVLVAGCNAFFIKHATNLYHLAPVERAAHTPIGPAEMPGSWAELWRNMEAAATTWFIEMNINLAALPLFLFGAYLLIKNKAEKNTQGRLFWMAWTLSFAIFSVLFIARFADHDYYITPTLPLAALVSSYGAARLWQYRRGRWALAILAPLILSIAVSRSYSRWLNSPQIPLTLREQAADIAALIPKDDLVLVQGDKTPIVFLYYLKRKGYSVDAEVRELQSSRLRDFRWLVRYDDYKTRHPDLDKLVHLKFVKKIRSDFSVYQIIE